MVRPFILRNVSVRPNETYFKPRGVPMSSLKEVVLSHDCLEAIKLSDLEGLYQEEAGKKMGVSRATFGRILEQGRKIIADALINGKAIRIEGGNVQYKELGGRRRRRGRRF